MVCVQPRIGSIAVIRVTLTVEIKDMYSKTDERGLFGVYYFVPRGQSLRPPRRLYHIRPITQ
jgi:hypothetical protein